MVTNAPLEVNVEVDDRTVLFPAGKFLSLILVKTAEDEIHLDAVFVFNEERTDSLISALTKDDAFRLARAIMDAVFQGRTQSVVTGGERIGVVFQANGFVILFGNHEHACELFITSPAIIRLAHGLLRVVDRMERRGNN